MTSFSLENALHFLWREVITLDGVKIYYNPFTGWYVSMVTSLENTLKLYFVKNLIGSFYLENTR